MDSMYPSEEQIRIVQIKKPEKISLSDEYNDDDSIDPDTHFNTNEYFEENYIEST
jgi:hypothetical protein